MKKIGKFNILSQKKRNNKKIKNKKNHNLQHNLWQILLLN